ncbi:hypothetical protein OPQ81_008051 [Rhizoctonia solani]|nr:hypothetical protein OPQ81_008051 [Rhizoctonia solani]
MRAQFIVKKLFPILIKPPTRIPLRLFGTHEELLHKFDPAYWYPVTVGQVLNDTYKLVAKLGFGNSSTVWLARDITRWSWQSARYVTLKISTSHAADSANTDHYTHEAYISNQILHKNPSHPGLQFLRTAIGGFEIKGQKGPHSVLVYEPMRESMLILLDRFEASGKKRQCEPAFVKKVVRFILSGLDYLHNECRIVHRDVSLSNILIPIESPSLLTTLEKSESQYPFPQNHLPSGYIVHMSHEDLGPILPGKDIGPPKIHDFGSAIELGGKSSPLFTPASYAAPEILLECEEGTGADVWSVGMIVWELLAGSKLFQGTDPEFQIRTKRKHLADLISLLGPPPSALLSRGKLSLSFFNSSGKFKYSKLLTPDRKLKSQFMDQMSHDEQDAFLDFMKGIVIWDPRERKSVKELREHRWLVQ